MGKGTKQLEAMRAKGRPVTPRMEEFAKYLDSLDEEEHTLKPGKCKCGNIGEYERTAKSSCGLMLSIGSEEKKLIKLMMVPDACLCR